MVPRSARVFGFVLLMMGVGCLFPTSGVAAPTLDEMKDSFAELMHERAGLSTRAREAERTLVAGRETSGRGQGATTPTGKAYRQAVLRIEQALDRHPQIKAVREELEAVHEKRVAASQEQAAILMASRETASSRRAAYQEHLREMSTRAGRERAVLMQQAGVKNSSDLSTADYARLREIHARHTNELSIAKATYREQTSSNAVHAARVADGSQAAFEALNERYREFDRMRSELQASEKRLRRSLRRDDPEIANLEQAMREANAAHLRATASRPEAVAARELLSRMGQLRDDIDVQARILRRAILALEPEYKPTLDKQAAPAGLAQVGESFWEL